MNNLFQFEPFIFQYQEYVYLAIGIGMVISILYGDEFIKSVVILNF